jgi:preprotein translocase subunit SecA
MARLGANDDTPIENRMISRSLEKAQERVEGYNFDQRKNVVKYDDVMNRHRKAVYSMRREVLKATDISKRIKKLIEEEAHAIATSPMLMSDQLDDVVREVFPFDEPTLDRLFDTEADRFEKSLTTEAKELYNGRELAFTPEVMRNVERVVYLQILDNLWMQHLENMDHLREGIHWISVGQQDPLVEYRRRGQLLFDDMQMSLRHDIVRAIFHVELTDAERANQPVDTELTRAARGSVDNAREVRRGQEEFDEKDFDSKTKAANQPKAKQADARKKARKTERKRKTAAKRRNH